MRLQATFTALVLPAVVLSQAQKPLQDQINDGVQDFISKAKSYLPFLQTVASNPIDTAASRLAAKSVTTVTLDNWKEVLTPSPGNANSADHVPAIEPYMLLFSGGNKSCFGQCEQLEHAWHEAVVAIAAMSKHPQLRYANCDDQPIFCSIWFAGPPAVWYIQRPVSSSKQIADQSPATTQINPVTLNTTTVTAKEIIDIYTKETWKEKPVYEGYWHPFDGEFAKTGLNYILGYTFYGFGVVPSWMIMITVSFLSRSLMQAQWKNRT
ncbi:hypothetical protein MMC25_002706 [Agyrium rufum]|nr:hypothetical protein [Agyrium rufum]